MTSVLNPANLNKLRKATVHWAMDLLGTSPPTSTLTKISGCVNPTTSTPLESADELKDTQPQCYACVLRDQQQTSRNMANELTHSDVFDGEEPIKKLIEELDAMYPHITPNPKDDIARIMYRSGQRSVVDYLLAKLNNV